MGAIVDFAQKAGWDLVPAVDYRAFPSGMVGDEVLEKFWAEFSATAREALREGVDALYLVLHGAMVSQSFEDVEGEILERFRQLPGAKDIPVFGVTDLHGNITERTVRHASLLVTYRENPHTDAAAAAVRAGQLLDRTLQSGRQPKMYLRQLPFIWPPTGTATADSPMRELEAAARRFEAAGHASVDVYAGFALADTHDTGASVTVSTTRSEPEALAVLDAMEQIALEHASQGFPREWSLDAAFDDMAQKRFSGPTLLVEPADNIGGGAPGDCTCVLRALISQKIAHAASIINDPMAVQQLATIALGSKIRLAIGGKGSGLDPGPLDLEVQLLSRSDGVFEVEDRQSHLVSIFGSRIEMGPCAVVRSEGTTILLTSKKTPPMDLGQWRSQGFAPEQFSVINIKAAVAHRRAYDKIAAASYTVETPGPCASNLTLLPFRRIQRPIRALNGSPSSPKK